ncbi:MAG: HNH endonuclease [Ilumatobacter sp.]|nr:HNH endonuclease [Ilumatobacter sp.]
MHTPSHTGRDYRAEPPSPSSQATRRPGWRALRRQVIARDTGSPCALCGRLLGPGDALDVDHITPASRGGQNTLANLRAVHSACNRSRRAGGEGENPRPIGGAFDGGPQCEKPPRQETVNR